LYMAVEPATVPIIFSKDRRLTALFSVSLIVSPSVLRVDYAALADPIVASSPNFVILVQGSSLYSR
jgi:hypothetical protein